MKTYHTFSSGETRTLGAVAAERALSAARRAKKPRRNAGVIALHGDLGAGKTTFVQGFLRALGVRARVASPTFVLVKRFPLGGAAKKAGLKRAYHVDAYRLRAAREAEPLGLTKMFTDPEAVVLVEWPERLGKLLPKHTAKLNFSPGRRENERIIKAYGGVLS